MHPGFSILAPFLALLPALSAAPEARESAEPVPSAPVSRPPTDGREPWSTMATAYRPLDADQVRIEQTVTIRIGPRAAPVTLAPISFESNADSSGPRLVERKFGNCVPVAGIVGVQPAPGNRLLLIMRDQRLLTASLKKGCNSRDYYSGFLIARNQDGLICTGRDKLLARSGANCQVDGFRQLIQVGS
jgi:hypothetical protein